MTVQEFLGRLQPHNQDYLREKHPELFNDFLNGRRSDAEFARLLKAKRSFAVDVFWLFAFSDPCGIAITKGWYETWGKGCQRICNLHGDKLICPCVRDLAAADRPHPVPARESLNTCDWLIKAHTRVVDYFLVEENKWNYTEGYPFFDWLCGRIGSQIQYKLQQKFGHKPPDNRPMSIRRLAKATADLRYIRIWDCVYFYQNSPESLYRLFPDEEQAVIDRMLQEVQETFEKSREIESWMKKFQLYKRLRLESGIPLKLQFWLVVLADEISDDENDDGDENEGEVF